MNTTTPQPTPDHPLALVFMTFTADRSTPHVQPYILADRPVNTIDDPRIAEIMHSLGRRDLDDDGNAAPVETEIVPILILANLSMWSNHPRPNPTVYLDESQAPIVAALLQSLGLVEDEEGSAS